MRLTNRYGKTVDWKAFNASDTACVIGIGEGTVNNGASGEFAPPGNGEIRVAVKVGLLAVVDPRAQTFARDARPCADSKRQTG